tara:strand:+ start:366 stop:521 length:156 start_codon:yes stop_codon:yes gene_type:complete
MQPGDVESKAAKAAKADLLENWINFKSSTLIEIEVHKFAKCYLNYYRKSLI